jgi:hypothetical protein
MKILISTLFLLLLFHGCSFKSPENQWEYNSASAFNSYAKNFLTNKLAEDDLNRAIKYAKQSANLEQLARIYLGVCALNISVGKKDDCKEYKKIEDLVPSLELKAYFLMLQNRLEKEDIKTLPTQYQDFSEYKKLEKYNLAFESIKDIELASSKFIAASMIKNKMKKSEIKYIIKEASFYGYKKVVLFWLDYLKQIEVDKIEKEKIEKKLLILNS